MYEATTDAGAGSETGTFELHRIMFELFNEIGIISQLSSTMLSSVLPKSMTPAQFTILNHYVRLEIADAAPADLARAFQVTRPTITSTLARMERSGLVAIVPDPSDGRGKLVSLTPTGRAMRETCLASLSSLWPRIAAIADIEGLAAILPVLKRLRFLLDRLRD
jgi:DNA-binding MarR family transcriptional regulator